MWLVGGIDAACIALLVGLSGCGVVVLLLCCLVVLVGVVMLVFWYLVWWLLGGKGGVKEMVLSVRNCRIVGFKYSKYVIILGG